MILPDTPLHHPAGRQSPSLLCSRWGLLLLSRLAQGNYSVKTGCSIHAYVPMTNHVHLLPGFMRQQQRRGALMKALGRRYVQYVNRTYRRSGTLGRAFPILSGAGRHLGSWSASATSNSTRCGRRWCHIPASIVGQNYRANAQGRGKHASFAPSSLSCARRGCNRAAGGISGALPVRAGTCNR